MLYDHIMCRILCHICILVCNIYRKMFIIHTFRLYTSIYSSYVYEVCIFLYTVRMSIDIMRGRTPVGASSCPYNTTGMNRTELMGIPCAISHEPVRYYRTVRGQIINCCIDPGSCLIYIFHRALVSAISNVRQRLPSSLFTRAEQADSFLFIVFISSTFTPNL